MSVDPKNYGGFFQFPLCLLAAQDDFHEVIERAMNYGIVHFLDKTGEGKDWRGDQAARADALKKAQNVIGFTGGDIDYFIRQADKAENFLHEWRRANRSTCEVRVRKDFMYGARDKGEPTDREFRILAAIFSAMHARSVPAPTL